MAATTSQRAAIFDYDPPVMQAAPFLGPDDPPAYSILNPQGRAPVLLVCDHASRALPRRYGDLGLDPAELYRHIAWDIGAADVTRRLCEMLDAPAVLSGFSRLLVDCNRKTDDPTFICQVSDGTVVPGNRGLAPDEIAGRIDAFHAPYHRAIERTLADMRARVAAPALFSIHSFTPVMRGFERPWHVGVLWNRDPRLAVPLMRILRDDPTLVVGDNEPYSGKTEVGYTMVRHGARAGLPHVLLEIRQDLIDTHHGADAWAMRIGRAIQRLMADAGPFAPEMH